MHGTGVPLVTPFNATGGIDESKLEDIVRWVQANGVDFIVPCGSNSESELMTTTERTAVIQTVVDAADVPVMAGTGHPGYVETIAQTQSAADAGADAALVVTPFYFSYSDAEINTYYREVADASSIPIYLYNVPGKTGVCMKPETIAELSQHDNICGIKDSSGDLEAFIRTRNMTGDDFDLFIGSGSLYSQGLDAGAKGGILALANVIPEICSNIYNLCTSKQDNRSARSLNREVVELNYAITKQHGVPGVKAAMESRQIDPGQLRSPFEQESKGTRAQIAELTRNAVDLVD